MPFEARIAGDGPLRAELEARALELGLGDSVRFLGQVPHPRIWEQFAWADALLHTGVIAPSGDRDGLPNVIPEAMAVGVLVVTSPAAATTEAITDGASGFVARVESPADWVAALRRVAGDDALAERLRAGARQWVEAHYDAHRNTEELIGCFRAALGRKAAP